MAEQNHSTAPRNYQVVVFGKAGCDKCAVLNKRIDKLLEKPEWNRFEKVYHDILTEDGLIDFCNAECINPQRIPAFVIRRRSESDGRTRFLQNPAPGRKDPICGSSQLYTYLGLQTDYTDTGLITPRMIARIFEEALQA